MSSWLDSGFAVAPGLPHGADVPLELVQVVERRQLHDVPGGELATILVHDREQVGVQIVVDRLRRGSVLEVLGQPGHLLRRCRHLLDGALRGAHRPHVIVTAKPIRKARWCPWGRSWPRRARRGHPGDPRRTCAARSTACRTSRARTPPHTRARGPCRQSREGGEHVGDASSPPVPWSGRPAAGQASLASASGPCRCRVGPSQKPPNLGCGLLRSRCRGRAPKSPHLGVVCDRRQPSHQLPRALNCEASQASAEFTDGIERRQTLQVRPTWRTGVPIGHEARPAPSRRHRRMSAV